MVTCSIAALSTSLVQYKMILKQAWFPTQDDPERRWGAQRAGWVMRRPEAGILREDETAGLQLLVVECFRAQELESYSAVELEVLGFVDDPIPPSPILSRMR